MSEATETSSISQNSQSSQSKKAVLMLNLGSPESTEVADVRTYLKEFLMDERVLAMPHWKRWLLVNLLILPSRPKKSAAAYSRIWQKEGSPLLTTTKKVVEGLNAREDINVPVHYAMRYGNPSTPSAFQQMAKDGVTECYVMPLYPHYAMSSYETAWEWAKESAARIAPGMKLTVLPPFYKDAGYLNCLLASAQPYINRVKSGELDRIQFSFHGIPERHLQLTDPTGEHCMNCTNCCGTPNLEAHAKCYSHQCFTTAHMFGKLAGLEPGQYGISFQSRLGREPWMTPYTDLTLEALPEHGYKKVAVICPAFVADNLETLEEIAMEGKEEFEGAGGEHLELIPCLNAQEPWMDWLAENIKANT